MKGPAISVVSYWDDAGTGELIERRSAEIFEDCERAVKLDRPDPLFRSRIVGTIKLCCSHERSRIESQRILLTLPTGTTHQGANNDFMETSLPELNALAKSASRKRRTLTAFDLLVKSLASAYWDATGRRPTAAYSEPYERRYGDFLDLVEMVLQVVAEISDGTFPQPRGEATRAKKIQRILKSRSRLFHADSSEPV